MVSATGVDALWDAIAALIGMRFDQVVVHPQPVPVMDQIPGSDATGGAGHGDNP